jgi:methylase of polypeptide subunit release factors
LGQSEPYWSVLTAPEFRGEKFKHDSIFYETGNINVEEFAAFAARSGFSFSSSQTCFELGCGVGRLTTWLASRFGQVIAADISRHHLDIAAAGPARPQHKQCVLPASDRRAATRANRRLRFFLLGDRSAA